uniref:hypothetical protein n=1 Tax=Yoonia sp. TaxID=2212373 RepID=UPI004047F639
MQRTTTINPRYAAVFERNAAYMPLKPKYRPVKSRYARKRRLVGGQSGIATKKRGNPMPSPYLSMVPYAGQEQKFTNLYLDNIPVGTTVTDYLVNRVGSGTQLNQRNGCKYKVDAIHLRVDAVQSVVQSIQPFTTMLILDKQPNQALIDPTGILQPGPVPDWQAFLAMTGSDERFVCLHREVHQLAKVLTSDELTQVGGTPHRVQFDRYVTVPKGKAFETLCATDNAGTGIDAIVKGAFLMLVASSDSVITMDANIRVYFHDI